MKKYFVLTAFFFLFSLLGNAQTRVWTSDSAHSSLGFTIKHLTISEVEGRFTDFTVKVTTVGADYKEVNVVLTAKVASINTNSSARDKHLLGADFFDADQFPLLVFESTSVKHIDEKEGVMVGNLTMRGITKPITLKVVYFGSVINPMNKKETAGFKVTGIVKRSDYAIGEKYPGAVLGSNVNIVANVEFSPNK